MSAGSERVSNLIGPPRAGKDWDEELFTTDYADITDGKWCGEIKHRIESYVVRLKV